MTISLHNDRLLFASTTFGLGYLRPASGTWGSLPPCFIAAAIAMTPVPWWINTIVMLVIAIVFSIITVAAGDRAEARWGKDPSNVVADETAGQALTLAFLPWAFWTDNENALSVIQRLGVIAIAFFIFRILDIIKPPPARGLQSIRAGWGILIDDLVVALMALPAVAALAALAH